MKKILVGLLLLSNSCVLAEDLSSSDFMELDDPYQYVTGAYWGVSVGPTFVKHKLTADSVSQNTSISKTQFDCGLLAGLELHFTRIVTSELKWKW